MNNHGNVSKCHALLSTSGCGASAGAFLKLLRLAQRQGGTLETAGVLDLVVLFSCVTEILQLLSSILDHKAI